MVLFRTKFGAKKVGRPKSVKRKCANITNRVTFSFARSFTRSLIRSFVRLFFRKNTLFLITAFLALY